MAKGKLTAKQQVFVDCYAGNASEAARQAGYKNPGLAGYENMKKHVIQKAIACRNDKEQDFQIATRQQRQEFWSGIMFETVQDNGKPPTLKDRLKASELLGRSEADFTDNRNVDLKGSLSVAEAIIQADKEKS